ncbi:choice-of-anchor P family protein [Streptomyces niveus]|uniref:Peptidoglycan DD-metalloendopeptidase family protein n=1 Tax=Streptomyces niveus TaxID=193462 RepID=A0ABZ2A7Z9_STRNV|nr:choice-of-anchor P family protein [Streptomyces niveus]
MRKRIAVVLSTALVVLALGAPTASADPDNPPDFKMPFPCGQAWAMFTYEGHGPADGSQEQKRIDMQWPDGETDGADVVASAGGTVSHVEPGGVHIDHGNGWFSQYLHMSDRVEEGKVVKEGDWIGNASNVGTNDPHLHYQQMYDFDGNGYPTEGGDGGPDELVHPVIQGKEYRITPGNAENLKSTNSCDGGGDPEPEPEPEKTALTYTGDTSISNGSAAELSAVLEDKAGEPVADRPVTFELGDGDSAQTCEGTTDAKGAATCPIDEVEQPLSDDATVPLTAAFEGDDEYEPSDDTANLDLRYVTGRGYGLSAKVPLPLLPLVIDPTPDTGTVREANAETASPECAEGIEALVLSAGGLCSEVVTETGPSRSTATSTVADVSVGLPGLPAIEVSGITATSTSTCSSAQGSVSLELSIAGTPVSLPDTPNFVIDLGVAGKLVVNEQIPADDADKGLTVNAVHLTALGGADVVIGSTTTGAFNCP